ncbi:MAG: shikimate dehydrogenase [Flaviflexus sp.]|nr:shikimate dehydrogenase [Flaviflexus sp.]
MKRAGVAGDPIAHSLSPVLHRAAYADLGVDLSYDLLPTPQEKLDELLDSLDASWAGISLTMPHKQAVIPRLDMVDGLAKTVGAVNTVCVQPTGNMLVGFNTDVAGIVSAVREVSPEPVSSCLILGGRATASSTLAAAVELGTRNLTIAARNHGGPGSALTAATRMNLSPELMRFDPDTIAARAERSSLLVSTVPAGVADRVAEELAARQPDLSHLTVLDVVYEPWPSRLTAVAGELGARIVPGWLMLVHQAARQVRLFTGRMPRVEVMKRALEEELARR